jgi:hypothetical protein
LGAFDVQIYSDDLPKVARRLHRAANPLAIHAQIRGGMGAVGPIARAAIGSAARDLPSSGRKHTGLRARIARAASARTVTEATGPALVVGIRREVMGSQRSLPGNMEIGQWRHPLFGNDKRWVTQTGKRGWFTDAISGRVVPAMELAMVKTARRIAESFVKK